MAKQKSEYALFKKAMQKVVRKNNIEERKIAKRQKALRKKQPKRDLKKRLDLWKSRIRERDANICQKCNKNLNELNSKGKPFGKHPHHIISWESVKENFPELIDDLKNGVLLCARCHKYASDSAHQGGFEFCAWLFNERKEQFDYLWKFLETHSKA